MQIQEVNEGDGQLEEGSQEDQYQEMEQLENVDTDNNVIYLYNNTFLQHFKRINSDD